MLEHFPKFIEKRIWYINDILTPDGKTFGFEEFKKYYNIKINFMDFFSITHSIPRLWKGSLIKKLHI